MRIIAGKYKSRIINAPKGIVTRPTSDKARESIFNVLAPYMYKANVLDLFAGSGAFGLEALSRGANFATFIDHDEDAIRCIHENINNLKLNNQCQVFKEDYHFISQLKSFDLIFFDPPYKMEVINEIIKLIDENHLLNENGVLIYETNKEHALLEDIKGYQVKIKKYGIAYVHFLYKQEP